jgi:hypothetical protein
MIIKQGGKLLLIATQFDIILFAIDFWCFDALVERLAG